VAFFSLFFHFFINFFFRFLHTFSILPTTVGDVAGLVVDVDGLVTRDVGESDVVVRLVIPGWRRVGKSSFVMSCSFNGKLAIRDRWLSVPLPPG